jgi:hypothetical protein
MSAARDKVIGSTMRNIGGMLPMGTGRRRISTAAQLEARVAGRQARQLERVPVVVPERELVLVVVPELELERVPVVVPERELVLVVVPEPELERGPVAALELPIVPVAALGLPIVLAVAAELELVQVAVALRTRSVTAAHRRGLVPVLTAEDLAAAAETTREPAAAEAVIAWEVAE